MIGLFKVIVHSPVAGLLLGSVTQRLLHIAHRPVLAVPPGAPTS